MFGYKGTGMFGYKGGQAKTECLVIKVEKCFGLY